MSNSAPPKAIGKIFKDRVLADADIFENYASHYMKILCSKNKCNLKRLNRTGYRRSERLKAKTKIINENICKKKIKKLLDATTDSGPDVNMPIIRFLNVEFKQTAVKSTQNIVYEISDDDDDDVEVINQVPDCNNNEDLIPPIEVESDSSSDEENDQNKRKGYQFSEAEVERQFYFGGPSNQTEGICDPMPLNEQTYQQGVTSAPSIHPPSNPIGDLPYHYPRMPWTEASLHEPCVPSSNHVPSTPSGGLPYRCQEIPKTKAPIPEAYTFTTINGTAPEQSYSDKYSSNQSPQERGTTPSTHPHSTPEQASHSFSDQLSSDFGHCIMQVNQLSAQTIINDRPTSSGIFTISFGNNQHKAYISGNLFFNSEVEKFHFEQHFLKPSRMSDDVRNQKFDRNNNSQPRLQSFINSEQIEVEDESAQMEQCNPERCLSPSNTENVNKYDTIEVLDSCDEESHNERSLPPSDNQSDTIFMTNENVDRSDEPQPANDVNEGTAAPPNPMLNTFSFMTMISERMNISFDRLKKMDFFLHDRNIRMRADTPYNISSSLPSVEYYVIYDATKWVVLFNYRVFTEKNREPFLRYFPWLLGIWYQRHFKTWVVDIHEVS